MAKQKEKQETDKETVHETPDANREKSLKEIFNLSSNTPPPAEKHLEKESAVKAWGSNKK